MWNVLVLDLGDDLTQKGLQQTLAQRCLDYSAFFNCFTVKNGVNVSY